MLGECHSHGSMEASHSGTVKLHYDASVVLTIGQATICVIARNHKGKPCFYMCQCTRPCNSIEEAEACAALVCLSILSAYYIGPIILEVECELAKKLQAGMLNCPACFSLIGTSEHFVSS